VTQREIYELSDNAVPQPSRSWWFEGILLIGIAPFATFIVGLIVFSKFSGPTNTTEWPLVVGPLAVMLLDALIAFQVCRLRHRTTVQAVAIAICSGFVGPIAWVGVLFLLYVGACSGGGCAS